MALIRRVFERPAVIDRDLAAGGTRTVGTVVVEATQDDLADVVNVITGTPVAGQPGHYDLAGLSGLGGAMAGTVKLRVTVDGEVKPLGAAPWATFTFAAAGGGMGGM